MSDNKDGPLTLELINNCLNELARELGTMDPDDPLYFYSSNDVYDLQGIQSWGNAWMSLPAR